MSCNVWTARIDSTDPDRLDITRKSGGPEGIVFAPSWKILGPALGAVKRARQANDGAALRATWERYVDDYAREMVTSAERHPDIWRRTLARPRVVLVCYCADHFHCHRFALAAIFEGLGATVGGEIARGSGRSGQGLLPGV